MSGPRFDPHLQCVFFFTILEKKILNFLVDISYDVLIYSEHRMTYLTCDTFTTEINRDTRLECPPSPSSETRPYQSFKKKHFNRGLDSEFCNYVNWVSPTSTKPQTGHDPKPPPLHGPTHMSGPTWTRTPTPTLSGTLHRLSGPTWTRTPVPTVSGTLRSLVRLHVSRLVLLALKRDFL